MLWKALIWITGIWWGFCCNVFAQNAARQHDSQFVFKDGYTADQYLFLSFWIDTTGKATPASAYDMYQSGRFRPVKKTLLSIGLNPHPLWLVFDTKYTGDRYKIFWWNFFTHADSVYIYEEEKQGKKWLLKDRLSYQTHSKKREEPLRFLSSFIDYMPGQERTFLIKVIHRHTPQNFITDFGSPKNILLWERDFYWSVGVFVGCSLMVLTYSMLVGSFSRKKVFFTYALYLLSVIILCLQEELLSSLTPQWLFPILYRLPGINMAVFCLILNFLTIADITNIKNKRPKIFRLLSTFMNVSLVWTIIGSLIYMAFFRQIIVGTAVFNIIWYSGLALIFLSMLCTTLAILIIAKKRTFYWNILAAALILYFNPGGYFLNYEGIIPYYQITYPNYFYWILLLEFIVLGGILSWQYSQSVRRQKELLNEKTVLEKTLYQRELEAEKKERAQLAQDLHDELAGTLSAVKLYISDHYRQDYYLRETIEKANIDVRAFLDKLSDKNILEKGIFIALSHRIKWMNRMNRVAFEWIAHGQEHLIPKEDYVNLFWIANELFSNIIKHSQARQATVQLMVDEDQYNFIVEDDGIGMPLNGKEGMGMENIRRRLSKLGNAEIHISTNNKGTTIIITKQLCL